MEIKNYTLTKEQYIEELRATAYLFRHNGTGTPVLYLSCPEDDNKVFGIGFKTLPENDYGIPHILEHTVLNGSRKYPVKEPFVELLKGSLNTFLNAMTDSDMTVYPIASRNEKDFMNLMDVYLDAVFFPNVKKNENIFRQEGWHFELNGKDEPITYKGVVYNEMKGAYSSPDEVLTAAINRALYPESIYRFNSGGDPVAIPSLTYKEFVDFHNTYYHPSNSFIFFYGNGDVEKHLTYVDEEYLKNYSYDERSASISIKPQPVFEGTKEVTDTYSIAEGEDTKDKTYLAYSTMLRTAASPAEHYGRRLLSIILGSGESSPIKLALIKAGIGKDISVSINNNFQPVLNIVAKNADASQKEEFVRVIRDTLEDVVKNGLNEKLVEATINSAIFQLREANYGSAPKGLILGFDCLSGWLYGKDPIANLAYEAPFKEIKETPRFFEKMIDDYILKNPHTVITTLLPEPGKNAKLEKETVAKLAEYKKSLSEEEIDALVEMNKELRAFQVAVDSPEALRTIPQLEREDLTLPKPFKEATRTTIGSVPVSVYTDNTNHIVYASLGFNMKDIAKEDIPYVGLLSSVYSMVNTKNFAYTELDNEIGARLGGFSFDVNIKQDLTGAFKAYMTLASKCLLEEVDSLVRISKEVLLTTDFSDAARLKEIISEARSQMEDAMAYQGNQVAQNRAYSYFDPAFAYREKVSGVDYFRFLKDLEENFEEKQEEVIASLKKVADILVRQDEVSVRLALTEDDEEFVKGKIQELIAALPQGMSENAAVNADRPVPEVKNEGFTTPGQVQFVSRVGRFSGEYNGKMVVLAQILRLDYLWNKVRAQGGAYGCRQSIDRLGRLAMTSYRDPNLEATVDVFNHAGSYMAQFDADEREMTKYIIGTMAALDPVRSVSMKASMALDALDSGLTNEMIQKVAKEALSATPEEIREAAKILDEAMSEPFVCVVGSEPKVNAAKELFKEVSKLI